MQYWDYAFSLLFLLIPLCILKGTFGLTIYQTPSVTVKEGNTAIMNCTLSEESLGPVRWYKGGNQQQQLLYSQSDSEKPDPRVNRTVKEGPTRETDQSIAFTLIRLEDAGVYYCVKFKSDKVTVAANGSGTHLYVNRIYGENIYQTPSVSGTEGGTVTMNCTVFIESVGPVKWYKGKTMQKLLYSQVEHDKPDTRVSKATHKGSNRDVDFTITFSNITLEDAGTYYCVKLKSNKDTADLLGSGTQLYVSRKPSPPSISGPNERVMLHTYITFSCRSVRFYPPEVKVTWWENELELMGSKSEISSYNGSMAYQVQSNITVVARINTSVTCKINHALLDQPISSTFKINNIVKEPSPPSVSGPKGRVEINSSVVVSCVSTGFYPREINLTWWKNEEKLHGSEPDIQPYGVDKTYQVQSNITVQAEIDSYVTCKINHSALDQPINSTFKINDVVKGMPTHPSISGSTSQVVLNDNVTLHCTSNGFYPREINVTWLQHGRELQGSTPDIHLYGNEKTYRVLSNITVPAQIDSPVTCRINHIALDQPVNSIFEINSIVKGAPSHPSVSGPRDRVLLNTSVTLTCTSSGFYPSNVSVTWWKNETELSNPKNAVNLNEDKTYRVQSNITVLAEIDSTVTCKINHKALETPICSAFNINDIVKGIPSPPSLSGPTKQIMLNENVTLSCTSDGFYPKEINITWLQNGMEVLNSTNVVYLNMVNKGYHVQSNITVPAKIDSPVICRITHTALELPINSTFQMNSIVKGPPHPSVSGPRDRILINTNVTLTCTSSGFYPSNISVTWWKNGTELPNPKKAIHLYGEDKTYRVQSNITVLAEIDSTVTCKINHTALDKPLHSAFNINDIVKGLPSSPSISGPTKQIMLNENVALSCTSDGFYPKEINITWLQNGKEVLNSTNIVYLNTANKTYHVQSNITVPAKTDSPVICRITHTALELPITSTFQMNNIVIDPSGQGLPVKIAGAACGFLVFILLTVMFLIHRKSKQGKNNTTSGSIPANCEAENKQDENNDIITYAALQLRNGSSVPKKVAQEKATEYAEVRFKKRVQDNNIVYADINITKLHTKETIPHYYIEDRGAEYATVKKNTKPSKK